MLCQYYFRNEKKRKTANEIGGVGRKRHPLSKDLGQVIPTKKKHSDEGFGLKVAKGLKAKVQKTMGKVKEEMEKEENSNEVTKLKSAKPKITNPPAGSTMWSGEKMSMSAPIQVATKSKLEEYLRGAQPQHESTGSKVTMTSFQDAFMKSYSLPLEERVKLRRAGNDIPVDSYESSPPLLTKEESVVETLADLSKDHDYEQKLGQAPLLKKILWQNPQIPPQELTAMPVLEGQENESPPPPPPTEINVEPQNTIQDLSVQPSSQELTLPASSESLNLTVQTVQSSIAESQSVDQVVPQETLPINIVPSQERVESLIDTNVINVAPQIEIPQAPPVPIMQPAMFVTPTTHTSVQGNGTFVPPPAKKKKKSATTTAPKPKDEEDVDVAEKVRRIIERVKAEHALEMEQAAKAGIDKTAKKRNRSPKSPRSPRSKGGKKNQVDPSLMYSHSSSDSQSPASSLGMSPSPQLTGALISASPVAEIMARNNSTPTATITASIDEASDLQNTVKVEPIATDVKTAITAEDPKEPLPKFILEGVSQVYPQSLASNAVLAQLNPSAIVSSATLPSSTGTVSSTASFVQPPEELIQTNIAPSTSASVMVHHKPKSSKSKSVQNQPRIAGIPAPTAVASIAMPGVTTMKPPEQQVFYIPVGGSTGLQRICLPQNVPSAGNAVLLNTDKGVFLAPIQVQGSQIPATQLTTGIPTALPTAQLPTAIKVETTIPKTSGSTTVREQLIQKKSTPSPTLNQQALTQGVMTGALDVQKVLQGIQNGTVVTGDADSGVSVSVASAGNTVALPGISRVLPQASTAGNISSQAGLQQKSVQVLNTKSKTIIKHPITGQPTVVQQVVPSKSNTVTNSGLLQTTESSAGFVTKIVTTGSLSGVNTASIQSTLNKLVAQGTLTSATVTQTATSSTTQSTDLSGKPKNAQGVAGVQVVTPQSLPVQKKQSCPTSLKDSSAKMPSPPQQKWVMQSSELLTVMLPNQQLALIPKHLLNQGSSLQVQTSKMLESAGIYSPPSGPADTQEQELSTGTAPASLLIANQTACSAGAISQTAASSDQMSPVLSQSPALQPPINQQPLLQAALQGQSPTNQAVQDLPSNPTAPRQTPPVKEEMENRDFGLQELANQAAAQPQISLGPQETLSSGRPTNSITKTSLLSTQTAFHRTSSPEEGELAAATASDLGQLSSVNPTDGVDNDIGLKDWQQDGMSRSYTGAEVDPQLPDDIMEPLEIKPSSDEMQVTWYYN